MATNQITAPRTHKPMYTTYGMNSDKTLPKEVMIGSNVAVPDARIGVITKTKKK